MHQHEIEIKYKTPLETVQVSEYTFECEQTIGEEVEIPIGATDHQINDVTIYKTATPAKTKGFAFGATKKSGQASSANTVELTVYTNQASTATPDDTFIITPANGYSWNDGDPIANPLAADIASVYVTNSGNAIAYLKVVAGNDPTP